MRLVPMLVCCLMLATACDHESDPPATTGDEGASHSFSASDCANGAYPVPLGVTTDRQDEIDYLDDIVACTDEGRSTVWLANNSDAVWELYLNGEVQALTLVTSAETAFAAATGASTAFVPEATMVFSSYVPYEWHVNSRLSAMWVGFDTMKDEFQSWGEAWAVDALDRRTRLGAAVATCSLAFGDVIDLDFEKAPEEVFVGVFETASGGAACRARMAEVRYYDTSNQERAVLDDLTGLKSRAAVLDDVARKLSYTHAVSQITKFALRLLA